MIDKQEVKTPSSTQSLKEVPQHNIPDINKQKTIPTDVYGDYIQKYPQRNWDYNGSRELHHYKPLHFTYEHVSEYNFSMSHGMTRDDLYWLRNGCIAVSASALAAYKHPITKYSIVPISAMWMYYAYQYDLAHGDMINRISKEAHSILKNL